MNTIKNNRPLVFLPGWGFTANVWEKTAKRLNFPYHLFDLPLLDEMNLDNIVDFFLKKIPDNAILICWSLSGLVGIRLAIKFPYKLNKLILVTTTPRFMADENWNGIQKKISLSFFLNLKNNFEKLKETFLAQALFPMKSKNIYHELKESSEFFQNSKKLYKYLKLLFKTDLREEYANLKVPTLHILGEKDMIVNVSESALKLLNNDVQLIILPKTGHFPFIQNEDLLIKTIDTFVNDEN